MQRHDAGVNGTQEPKVINPTKAVPPLLVHVQDPDRADGICAWFLGCADESNQQVHHPTLGWVAICDGHLEWLLE